MSTERNKKIVARFLEQDLSRLRTKEIREAMAANATYWDSASKRARGLDELISDLEERIKPLAPDGMRIDIKQLTAEGDRVVAQLESSARLTNGVEYKNSVVTIFDLTEDGKIVRGFEYLDPTMLAQAFGHGSPVA